MSVCVCIYIYIYIYTHTCIDIPAALPFYRGPSYVTHTSTQITGSDELRPSGDPGPGDHRRWQGFGGSQEKPPLNRNIQTKIQTQYITQTHK